MNRIHWGDMRHAHIQAVCVPRMHVCMRGCIPHKTACFNVWAVFLICDWINKLQSKLLEFIGTGGRFNGSTIILKDTPAYMVDKKVLLDWSFQEHNGCHRFEEFCTISGQSKQLGGMVLMIPPADLQRSCKEENLSLHCSSPPKWRHDWTIVGLDCRRHVGRKPGDILSWRGRGALGNAFDFIPKKTGGVNRYQRKRVKKRVFKRIIIERTNARAQWATQRERVWGRLGTKTLLICSHTCYPLHHWPSGAMSIDYWFHLKSVWRAFKYTFIFF